MTRLALGAADRWGQLLLTTSAWGTCALVIWACFLLPMQGDWLTKLSAAGGHPALLPILIGSLAGTCLCRQPRWRLTGLLLAVLATAAGSSHYW